MTQTPGLDDLPRGTTAGGDGSGAVTAGMHVAEPTASIFDSLRAPSGDLIDDCVHCGFCLPTCPTYLLEGNETNSPRGRIYLMKMGSAGEVGMDEEFVGNFDACLGCMACVTACPSGVQYDHLIEAVRPQIERHWERTPADRAFRALVFGLFPYPSRLRPAAFFGTLYQKLGVRRLLAASGLIGRLPARLRAMEALLPQIPLRSVVARQPSFTPAVGTTRHRVGLLSGCVQRVFFGDVNAAATRVLAAEGCDVVAPPRQQCCGALSSHAGRDEEARDRARRLIDVFTEAEVETVVVTVAGCGSSMKEYAELLRDDPAYADRAAAFAAKVRDISELLVQLGPVAVRHPIDATVAYHDACHLRHAQGIVAEPRTALGTIPSMTVVDIPEADICCGSAGIYNLVQPEPAEELGRRKVAHIESTRPDAVATSNAGCLLQIRRYLDAGVPLFHPVELIDASLRGVDPVAAQALARGGPQRL
ncbi:(Fe-S)-binding protein [Microlunatus flavus]|uniref:Glycolate oxidase iron-sulfur subunit n=1 Tax=Microlunatus flavus TaxID=1036181 RepID=A0A1H9A8P2_9ACTN|nr:heterodisulfide reductase-related iron-sulfur binding cluster [Microlunatus flavus]SEP72857.1 glycolate oxidase iron-sulfur subunit [Microlunatus flavus]